jgi:uncharacterized phage infection (PIP) family protein YhgE
MSKVSVWKRFGGWIGRSNATTTGVDVVSVDPERLGVGPDVVHAGGEEMKGLATNESVADQKLAAIEDGFNRLVDIMGQVNDNLIVQRRYNEQQQQNVEPLAELMRRFPTVVKNQGELVDKLTDQLAEQSQHHEDLADTIKTLPEQAQAQVEQLGDITRKLESSGQTESQMLENLQAQSASLANVGELLEKNDQRLQTALDRQHRYLLRLFWVAMGCAGIAMMGVALFVWFRIQ